MKMMIDALPKIATIFLTTCWPVNAAIVATKTKYEAAYNIYHFTSNSILQDHVKFTSLIGSYRRVLGSDLEGNIGLLTWTKRKP